LQKAIRLSRGKNKVRRYKRMIFLGHEIWMEGPNHGHVGKRAEFLLKFGQNMKLDGRLSSAMAKATLFSPAGQKREIFLCFDPNLTREAYIVSFSLEEKGLYTLLLEYDGGIWSRGKDGRLYYAPRSKCQEVEKAVRYCQYSKVIVPVEIGTEGDIPQPCGCEMEIVPVKYQRFAAGDEIALKVLYDGSPFPNIAVSAIHSDKEQVAEGKTDSSGQAGFKLTDPGNWMFLARHVDAEKGVPGEFDEKTVTAVLSLPGVK